MTLKGKNEIDPFFTRTPTSSEKNNPIFGSEMPRRVRIIYKMYNFSSW